METKDKMTASTPEEICRLFRKYMREGDVDSLLSLYDAEAVFLNESGETRNREGLRNELAPLAAAHAEFDFDIRQVIYARDLALMHTQWNITAPGPRSVYAIEVARRQADGSWRWLIGDPFTVSKQTGQAKRKEA